MASAGAIIPVTRLSKVARAFALRMVAQALACVGLSFPLLLQAQQTIPYNPSAQAPPAGGRGGRGGRGPAQTARAAAPIDMTGYWVSVVTEDWRFRMVTPPKGNYSGVPLNAEGRKVADTWDPAKDEPRVISANRTGL